MAVVKRASKARALIGAVALVACALQNPVLVALPDAGPCGIAGAPCCAATGTADVPRAPCGDPSLVCLAGTCAPCAGPDHAVCDGACVSLASDDHCGACGTVCVGAERCVQGSSSVDGGTAGARCALQCPATQTACGATCNDLRSDPNHCGDCARRCDVQGAVAVCADGACVLAACTAGHADCDGDAANGCEADVATNPAHCGACAVRCSVPHATAGCAAGVCTVARCDAGWADCNGSAADGCEARTDDDAANCGACGHACMASTAVLRVACVSGACTSMTTCPADHRDCNGTSSDGCEAAILTDPSNCGACGTVCALPATASAVCSNGTCAVGTCPAGRGDCDGNAANGCETDVLHGNPAHCGACGRACSLPHTATYQCNSGGCGLNTCSAGWMNCDTSTANGCETDVRTAAHCGACGTACTAAQTCVDASGSGAGPWSCR